MTDAETSDRGSLILSTIRAIAISPERAMQDVAQYKSMALKRNPTHSPAQIEAIVSKKIINKYARYTALSGGAFALPGIVPGIGTAVAVLGGGAGDATACMKAQVDMTMMLAANFEWDMTDLDAQYMALLIALTGGLEKMGVGSGVPIASKAGVKMLQRYLKGATLATLKEFAKRFGVTFTRTSLEKAFPLGIGVAAGSSMNYLLTRYIGRQAVKCFEIERELRFSGEGAI